MKWSFPLLLLLSFLASSGQKTQAPAGFIGGVEADVLPFLTGGYYMSVWGGIPSAVDMYGIFTPSGIFGQMRDPVTPLPGQPDERTHLIAKSFFRKFRIM